MEVKKLNYWIVIIILIISLPVVFLVYKRQQPIEKTSFIPVNIPYKIDDWVGKDIPLTDKIYQILETNKVILREYKNQEGDIIWLYVVFSEKNRVSFHPPEYCYIGSGGTELIEKKVVMFPVDKKSLSVNKLTFKMPEGKQLVLFWYMAGSQTFASYYRQQLHLIFNIIRGKSSQGMMVRLSTYIQKGKKREDFKKLVSFIKNLEPYLIK